jgi:hypothetical protein
MSQCAPQYNNNMKKVFWNHLSASRHFLKKKKDVLKKMEILYTISNMYKSNFKIYLYIYSDTVRISA